ncbi:MAG TPA: methyltransferase domain-containing protein [Terriglobia bacterium]
MPERSGQGREYALGHSAEELDRLSTQARLMEAFTRRVFEQAGIGPGMKVLDIGSGAGDVAFLVREMVGPEGKIVGTDRALEALRRSQERAAALGYSNVEFVQGDPVEMTFDEPFDALVGRFVLMYYPSPSGALGQLARHVRPGGIVAFQESDNTGARTFPPQPLFDRLFELMQKALEISKAEPRMALKLYPAFIAAGLPVPSMQAEVAVMGSQDPFVEPLANFLVQGLRSMMPIIVKHGLATEQGLDLDTYAQRLAEAFRAGGGIMMSPPFVGAWTRKAG